jgi:uncharacterized membrane protein YgdD (TMEM256/DUF423 family)
MNSGRNAFIAGSAFAFLAVAFGAFAAHGLKSRLSPEMLAIWETGARYQMYHALALFSVAFVDGKFPGALVRWAGRMFVIGILLFSGSLYLLAWTGSGLWGAVTPFGGTAFLAGWFLLGLAAMKHPRLP